VSVQIRFGFGFDMRNPGPWRKPWADHYREHLEFIAWTETLGFEQVWIAEHHGDEDGYCPSPLVVCATLAGMTKKMRLSTGIGLAPFYHPTRLAEDVAVLDAISNGRIELALGLGYLHREFQAYGVDVKTRGRRTDEIIHIVRRLWRGEEVTFDGEFYQLEKAKIFPLPIQKPHIPIYIGGAVKAGYLRAARHGDGYFGPTESIPDYMAAVAEVGTDPASTRVALIGTADSWLIVSDDPDKAMAEVAPHYFYQYNVYSKWLEEGDFVLPKMDLEQFEQSGILNVLPPDRAIEHIRARVDAHPQLDSYALQAPVGLSMDKFAPYVETFAKTVLPAFK
jgi:alkanesulfonate monooxygenase SsuD/methylene tetrahydromethanopterin reductase-like flavin-dependent oxidoreductase (luciferase family)